MATPASIAYSIPNRHNLASGMLLSDYDPYAHGLAVRAFREVDHQREQGVARDALRIPDLTIRAQGGLVLAHSIAHSGRDTVFYHEKGIVDLAHAWASVDIGQTVLGVELSAARGARQDVDTNPVMILTSVDANGGELGAPDMVGVEIEALAVDSLAVYRWSELPGDMHQFNPYEYIHAPASGAPRQ